MNLQENILRIREMMGVNMEGIPPSVRRRLQSEILKYIRSSYKWLKPNTFIGFDDFKERVIFSAVRDFLGDYSSSPYEERVDLREKLIPIVREIIQGEITDEIKSYYFEKTI